MSETETNKEVVVVQTDTRSWIERIAGIFSKKETLTQKLTVGLCGCTNGDRGMVVNAITEHDIKEKRINSWFIIGLITFGVIGTALVSFLINWLQYLIGM